MQSALELGAMMSSTPFISWILPQIISTKRSPGSCITNFHFFIPCLFYDVPQQMKKTKQSVPDISVFLHVCLRRGCESGPTYVCHVSGGTVSAMPVWIVMTCFVQFETHCKLYQSPNKSYWRENTTQDIRPFNDRGLRWRCSGLD